MAELNLWFTRLEAGFCELEQSVFIRDLNEIPLKSIRGKASGAYPDVGNFQWTPGVKAVACIFLTELPSLQHS